MNTKYHICGVVEGGKRLGRTIGFPTANIRATLPEGIPFGVYAARLVLDGQRYGCMVNIGRHPTVPDGKPTVEAHIFDFDGDIYGRSLQVETLAYLRPEVRFSSLNALKAQLTQDGLRAREILRNGESL